MPKLFFINQNQKNTIENIKKQMIKNNFNQMIVLETSEKWSGQMHKDLSEIAWHSCIPVFEFPNNINFFLITKYIKTNSDIVELQYASYNEACFYMCLKNEFGKILLKTYKFHITKCTTKSCVHNLTSPGETRLVFTIVKNNCFCAISGNLAIINAYILSEIDKEHASLF